MLIPALQRHIDACNNAILPGPRLPFHIGAAHVGWLLPDLAALLAEFPGFTVHPEGVTLATADTLQPAVKTLSERGAFRWRREAFDVRATQDGPVLTQIDRGALPAFGIQAQGIHINGLVHRPDGLHLWVARRAADKALDPGKCDHIVAGGVSTGMTPDETVIKEAEEEAGIPPELAALARKTSTVSYTMDRPEGLRRDLLHCYDLDLPEDFTPVPNDGEVAAFELWPIARAVQTVRDTDDFKFNVNLVLIDLFARLGLLP